MAFFPKIDSPCPLGIDEQRRINGHCGRCDKHVHALDGMSDADRRSLLADATGPICVSYRRSSRIASLAAVAITLVSVSAMAGEDRADTTPLAPIAQQQEVTPVAGTLDLVKPVDVTAPDAEELDQIILVGGISAPQDAEWDDESTLPELPIRTLPLESAIAGIERDAAEQPGASSGR